MTVLATANILRVHQSVGTVRAPEFETVATFTATINGLFDNPTHGPTAQVGDTLTAVAGGLVGGETVVVSWLLDDVAVDADGDDFFTVLAGQDTGVLKLALTIDSVEVESSEYTVRHVPPTFAALPSIVATKGSVPTIDLSAYATGLDLSYLADVAWITIANGVATIDDVARIETATITVENSGGSPSQSLDVEVYEVDQTPVVSGLVNNPTYGLTAQIGVELTGSIDGLRGGETVQVRWAANGIIGGANQTTYTPVANDHLKDLSYKPIINGVIRQSTQYVVRYAPPVAGSLVGVVATVGSVPTVNVAAGFSGEDLTYTVAETWASISGTTLTLADEVRTETLTITATNSGGSVTVDLSVEIGAVDQVASINGLTSNVTHGDVAQIGTVVTGVITGLRGGETVVDRWKLNGGIIAGENSANFSVLDADNLDLLRYSPTINGEIVNSTQHTIRYAPPVSTAIPDVSGAVGSVETIDLTQYVTGDGITYSVDVAWITIDGAGLATIADEVRDASANFTFSNSGGDVVEAVNVQISAVVSNITVGNSANSEVPGSVTSHVCDLPVGIAENDVVIVLATSDSNPDGYILSGGGITWTEVFDDTNGNAPTAFMAYGVVGASPGTTFTVDVGTARSNPNLVLAQAFSGVDTANVLDGSFTTASNNGGMPDAPSFTTTTNGAMRLIAGYLDDDTVDMTLSGTDGIATHKRGNCSVALAWRLEATAGEFDPDVFGGGQNDQWFAAHTALRPA